MSKVKAANEKMISPYAARPWLNHYDYWVHPHNNYPRRPLYEILRVATADVPDQTATVFLGAQLTFAEIKERSDKFATALAQLGFKQHDRIGIMLPNCPQYLIATFAVLRLGAIVVNVNPLYTPRELAVVARDSGMRALIVLDPLAPVALAVREQTNIESLIVTSAAEYSAAALPCPNVEGALRFADLIAGVTEIDLPTVAIDPEKDVAVLQYTGGTTGTPKGAMLTHYNIFANVVQAEGWAFRPTPAGRKYLSAGDSLLSHLRLHRRLDRRRLARCSTSADSEIRRGSFAGGDTRLRSYLFSRSADNLHFAVKSSTRQRVSTGSRAGIQ